MTRIDCERAGTASRAGTNPKSEGRNPKEYRSPKLESGVFGFRTSFGIRISIRGLSSLHPVEGLLENLPVFQAFDFFHQAAIDFGLLGVFGQLVDFVKNSEVAGEIRAGELI